jgi:hypothetical protein
MALTPRAKFLLAGTTVILTSLAFFEFYGSPNLPSSRVAPPPEANSRVTVGDEVILNVFGARYVYLATGDESWDEFIAAKVRQDVEEIGILIEKGKVIREANGTRAKVIKRAMLSTKVRIRDGANPGAEAWIESEFVQPAR